MAKTYRSYLITRIYTIPIGTYHEVIKTRIPRRKSPNTIISYSLINCALTDHAINYRRIPRTKRYDFVPASSTINLGMRIVQTSTILYFHVVTFRMVLEIFSPIS